MHDLERYIIFNKLDECDAYQVYLIVKVSKYHKAKILLQR